MYLEVRPLVDREDDRVDRTSSGRTLILSGSDVSRVDSVSSEGLVGGPGMGLVAGPGMILVGLGG